MSSKKSPIRTFGLLSLLLSFRIDFSLAAHPQAQPASIPELAVIHANSPSSPPAWALLQRRLIKTMEEAAPVYLKRFTRTDGTLYGFAGDVDDAYEMFYNWCLFYSMGADEKIFHWALRQWTAITRQFTYQQPQRFKELVSSTGPQLHQEFYVNHDWFHMSEGNMAFYDFGLADPTLPENVERARRFAGFYLNEDPGARNYDPKYKIVRSVLTGSRGPQFQTDTEEAKLRLQWSTLYPVVRELEPGWEASPKRRQEIQELVTRVVMQGDIPVNLTITGLMANAYLYTGEDKYKQWILDYVEAWMDRIRRNNGIVPDNVGPSGKIGENRQGQWWGGFWGWSTPFSMQMIYGALTVAAECAQLVSGDSRYLDLIRSQIDVSLSLAARQDEQLFVPFKYGPKGWEDFRPMLIRDLTHLWHASMDSKDWDRIQKVRGQGKGKIGPLPFSKVILKDWNEVASVGDRDDDNRTEYPRLQYYAGENPDWPEKILQADHQEVFRRLEFMRNDKRDIHSIYGDELYPNNPVITKGLQQVMLGAPQTIYNGGLLRARVRYFDVARSRPGLPPDVAALVERLEAGRTVVQLVNLSAFESRSLIVQAGAFGEHEFTEVKYVERAKDSSGRIAEAEEKKRIHRRFFQVDLAPASSIRLEIGTRLFVNRPTYAFPWHGDRVPVR